MPTVAAGEAHRLTRSSSAHWQVQFLILHEWVGRPRRQILPARIALKLEVYSLHLPIKKIQPLIRIESVKMALDISMMTTIDFKPPPPFAIWQLMQQRKLSFHPFRTNGIIPTYNLLACLVIWAPCGNATAGTAPLQQVLLWQSGQQLKEVIWPPPPHHLATNATAKALLSPIKEKSLCKHRKWYSFGLARDCFKNTIATDY